MGGKCVDKGKEIDVFGQEELVIISNNFVLY
jgi:hypothetical protein